MSVGDGPSNFVDDLTQLLARGLGYETHAYSIWMDRSAGGNNSFSDALLDNINQSAILMVIMSPAYLRSDWCRAEVNAFFRTTTNKSQFYGRVFIVEPRPTDKISWPEQFRNLDTFKFWYESDEGQIYAPLSKTDHGYFLSLERLATELSKVLTALRAAGSQSGAVQEPPETESPIWSAPTSAAWLEEKRDRCDYDVFLCHNSEDKIAVKQIGERLIEKRIVPWLDEWDLRPGLPWQKTLEEQIQKIKSAAVFVGESGFGPWQDMELDAFLREFMARRCPVIPVILSTCENLPQLPTFFRGITWVDFRKTAPEPMGRLIWGITGKRPTSG